MPDRRQHRGAHPDDARDFERTQQPVLRAATHELSWLLTREYSERAALKLVGDKHQLTSRQREAVVRAACTEAAEERRASGQKGVSELRGAELVIDGFNCLITLEVMLSKAPIFIGRDGAYRDLASVHGTYRRVAETEPSIELLVSSLVAWGVRDVRVLFDKPVANSGRLRAMFEQVVQGSALICRCELSDHVDRELSQGARLVASSDSWVLDQAPAWVDLPRSIAERQGFSLWVLDLR